MRPVSVDITGIRYSRLGYNRIDFFAEYDTHFRRGTVVFDTTSGTFRTHTKDVELLHAVILALSKYNYYCS